MKKLLMSLGLIALLAGCASHENGNGMGGTSDDSNQSMKTDSYNTTGSSDQHNNASNGTGSSTATDSNKSGQSMP